MKRLLLALAIFCTVLVPGSVSASHGGDNTAWTSTFTVNCKPSHTNSDDAIKFPGQPGASHLHQYWGAKNMNANTTYASAQSGGTTCDLKEDTAGYWTPALLTSSGTTVAPDSSGVVFYYYAKPVGSTATVDQAPPAGLKVIAQPNTQNVRFKCDTPTLHFSNKIMDCAAPHGVQVEITFPMCWNGSPDLDGTAPDHNDHMSYMVSGACPASHPIELSMPTFFVKWGSVTQGATQNYRLSSDPTNCATLDTCGLTLHADFWNTWNQTKLDALALSCDINHQDVPESLNDPGCRVLDSRAWSASPAGSPVGLMTNGGFENNSLTGWTATPAGRWSIQTVAKSTGTYGARAYAASGGTTSGRLYKSFSVAAGETVCLRGNIFPDPDGTTNANGSRVEIRTASGSIITGPSMWGTNGGGNGPGEFKRSWVQYTSPTAQTLQAGVFVGGESDGAMRVYVDDLSFTKSACASPA